MKNQNLFINSQINTSFSGGHRVTKNIINHFKNSIDFRLIGKDYFWTKMFHDNGFETYNDTCGYEPVTLRNILLFPISFLKAIYFLKYYKRLKNSNLIVFKTNFTEAFFLIHFIKLTFKTKILNTIHSQCPTVFKKTLLGKILKFLFGEDQVVFVSNTQFEKWQKFEIAPKNPDLKSLIKVIEYITQNRALEYKKLSNLSI